MPREDEHRLRSRRNEEFAASLDISDPINENWAVVALFYSALHYVEAYFVRFGGGCVEHKQRNERFKADVGIRYAYENYKYLQTLSHTARYQCSGLPDKAYEQASKIHLTAVKKQIDHAITLAEAQSSGQ